MGIRIQSFQALSSSYKEICALQPNEDLSSDQPWLCPHQTRVHWTVWLWVASLIFKLVKYDENLCTNLQMNPRKTKAFEMDISNELSRWRSPQVIVHISWGLGFSWIHLSVIFHTYYSVGSLKFLMQCWTWSDWNGADKPHVCCTDNQALWRWN